MPARPHGERTSFRYVPRVEALEDRTVPAGNVLVSIVGHTLDIMGDGSTMQIGVTGTGDHSVVIRALDGTTTLNGRSGPLFVSGFSDTYIHLGNGNNTIDVTGIGGEGLYVNLGQGNNTLTDNGARNAGVTFVDAGAGISTITLSNALFQQQVWVHTAGGNNQINATNIELVDLSVVASGGTDYFNSQGGSIGSPHLVGNVTTGTRPTTAPTVALTTSEGSSTNANPLVFTASFSSAVTGLSASGVQVTNGTVASVTKVDPQTYTIEVTPAAQGAVTATVLAGATIDLNGNANTVSNTLSVTYDSIAPIVTVNAQSTVSATPTITGTVDDPNSTVTVTVNGHSYTATVSGSTWSAPVTNTLASGTYSVTATATDQAGNQGTSAPANLIVDTTAPTLNLTAASDSGTVGDLRTDVSSVSLTGTALAGATVDLYQGKSGEAPGSGTLITTTRAGTNGTFTFNNVTLAAGANSFVVRAVDAAGNLGATFAQTFTLTTPPTVANPVADQTAMAGGSNLTFDLSNVFETSESVVRMTLTYPTGQTANLDVNLFSTQAETTVNNFLAYVNASGAGNYNNSVFDRLVQGFVLQGGAFKFDSGTFSPITAMSAIASQPLVSNTIGTIAMALTGSANTATDAFFFNLADNSTNLDQQSGGFTVFGQVMENGLQTLATLNGLHTYSGSGQPGTGPIPVASGANTTNFPANITTSDLVTLTNVSQLTSAQQLSYSVVSVTGNDVVTAGVTGSTLTITPVSAGTAVVTVQATDLDGSTTQTQIHVTVS